jgi:hypothetical protein
MVVWGWAFFLHRFKFSHGYRYNAEARPFVLSPFPRSCARRAIFRRNVGNASRKIRRQAVRYAALFPGSPSQVRYHLFFSAYTGVAAKAPGRQFTG